MVYLGHNMGIWVILGVQGQKGIYEDGGILVMMWVFECVWGILYFLVMIQIFKK
jgi:glycerol-3-phosphate acyltransferase PlsY